MKTLIREVYPEADTFNEAIGLFCEDTGYKRAAVWSWLSGETIPRKIVLSWLEMKKGLRAPL